jgi:hypothetical protein
MAEPMYTGPSKDSWSAYNNWAKRNPKEASDDLTSAQDDISFRENAYGKEYVDAVKKQKKKELDEFNNPVRRKAKSISAKSVKKAYEDK